MYILYYRYILLWALKYLIKSFNYLQNFIILCKKFRALYHIFFSVHFLPRWSVMNVGKYHALFAACVGAICAIIGCLRSSLWARRVLGLMEECFLQLHLKNNSICHCRGRAIYEWTANQFRLGQKHSLKTHAHTIATVLYRKLINDNQSKKEAKKYANEIIKRQTGIQFPFQPAHSTHISQSVKVRHLLASWTDGKQLLGALCLFW